MLDKNDEIAKVTGVSARPAEETDIKLRRDRIGRYLKKHLERFVFDEFSESYMEKAELAGMMKGVFIPLQRKDIESFKGGGGIEAFDIADNMARVIGADPHFKYTKNYVDFLNRLSGPELCDGLTRKGRGAAEAGELDDACVYFRAALCAAPLDLRGMYGYAEVCRLMYLKSGDEEYIGNFKAEATDYFELTTEVHPRFAQAYYYLGYAYINMGLYKKADLAWRDFLKKSRADSDKAEIRERLRQIREPIRIERGCNAVLSGRFEEGRHVLEPFLTTSFKTWWPLSYYLGVCYARAGDTEAAVENFKRVLTMNGSHIETMKELAEIFASENDAENEMKYRKKIELLEGEKFE